MGKCINLFSSAHPLAINFNSDATIDDGSCEYPSTGANDVLVEEFVMQFSSLQYIESSILELGAEY
nr:hypothetical protein [Bacteroidota bacterium]